MSSAYSIIHNYNQELYKPNLELMNTALQFKQGRYDANKAKLQTMYDRYSFLEVAKEQDQEHLEERLQSVKGIMDKYSVLDLSSNNLTNQLVANMGQVVDDKVTNAVVSTRRYQNEQAAWGKLKTENPEKYSQVNQAYANQASDAWLNDDTVGSKYGGGGGVIEYTDVQGKMAKEIPAIAKALKAEWVELAEGGGYFRDVLTKERVDRGRLESAMDGLLNEQDRNQLQINAWGQYDNMTDEQLEATYSNHFAPKIDSIKSTIKSLSGVIDSTENPKLKAQRQSILDGYQKQLDAYEANGYQNIVNNYGKESAYQTLYDNQFRSNYLDTYSYMDRVTKIATYDNDVKTRNYDLSLARLSETKRHNLVTEEAARIKASKTPGTGTAPGQEGYIKPLVGTEAVIEYTEEGSKLAAHNEKKGNILKQTQELFGIDNLGETRDLIKLFNEGFAGKEFIEYKGKKINVQENIGLLLEYQNNVINQSPVEKAAMEQFNGALDRSLGNLRRVAQGDSPDWDAVDSTPRFQFKFVEDKETGMMTKVPIDGDASNNYAALLKKAELTPEEEYTLNIYHKQHLLMDPELSNENKQLIFDDMQNSSFSKLTNEDFNSFPNDIHGYNRIGGRADSHFKAVVPSNHKDFMTEDGFFERHPKIVKDHKTPGINNIQIANVQYEGIVQDISDAYGVLKNADTPEQKDKAREKIQSLENILVADENTVTGVRQDWAGVGYKDYYLSDIKAGDAEFYDKDGNEVSLKSPSELITEGSTLFANTLETEYKAQDLNPSLYPQIFNTGTSGHSNLLSLVGLPSGAKESVTLQRVWDKETNQPTGEVQWSYQKMVKGELVTFTSEEEGPGRLKVDQLNENSVINFEQSSNTAYDASWGENASVVNLGSNTYDSAIKKANATRYGGNLPLNVDNTLPLMQDARKFGGEEFAQQIKAERQAFKEGSYSFKMESIDGIWQYAIYSEGEKIYNEPTDPNGVSGYSTNEVQSIYRESEYVVNNVMYNYLYSKIEEAKEEYILNYQEEQEKQF